MIDMIEIGLDTFNAKRLTPRQVAASFVMPSSFGVLASSDHTYVIGPRGSGKTTLLRMLTGESLVEWRGRDASEMRSRIQFSTILLPADELWASQATPEIARAAFTAQMLYAFVETMSYRTSGAVDVHLGVRLDPEAEADLCRSCAVAWGLEGASPGFYGLLEALDLFITRLSISPEAAEHVLAKADGLALLTFGVRAFNRSVGEVSRKWALLLDEMELAPVEIHRMVISFVRGGSSDLILKISMSPFDRYMQIYGTTGAPVPGHDFQTVYLSGQSRQEIRRITNGLWREQLRVRSLPYVSLASALNLPSSERDSRTRLRAEKSPEDVLLEAAQVDPGVASWMRQRGLTPERLANLSYNERSATVRKVVPLLIFRDSLLNFRAGSPVRRSRKKSFEPFTGPTAITAMLEGNPRWIKTALAQMLEFYDPSTGQVGPGFQYDALSSLANRFESLLRVLPNRQTSAFSFPVVELVDHIASYLSSRNSSQFNPDPPNSFTIDSRTPPEITNALILGLYAGAFVHVRDRRSPAVLSSFEGQRFRLAYLLGIRDGKEFPLRLGKDVSLTSILRERVNSSPVWRDEQLDVDF
ncbi:hypothetical protein [Marisediminicola sp. LYQ85]|uniref:ORC-CDC6 family AAA ATPase n=1 Tax=Marisediminicola sp. LYQ85 TaxID=3391062 RepID=UPI00398320C5